MTLKRIHPAAVFFIVRLALFLSLPLEGLAGYGDLAHFHGWAELDGWPFLSYWMEFPPLFPFLGEAIHALNMTAEGRLWLANLYSHVCVIEHGRRAMGPNPARPMGEGGGLVLRQLPRRAGA